MRSVCFSMVKNEEDIVESFVRHTLNQVDHLYIANNLSTDGTTDILRALVSEGLPITVTVDAEQALLQNEKMTAMYRISAKESQFDFAFFLDADEFLELDKDAMLSVQRSHGPGHAFYIPRLNYLYMGETTPGDPLSIFETMTTVDKIGEAPKSMIFHGEAECRRFRVGNGNHHVRDWARGGDIISEEQPHHFATISHFPIRSIDQYLRKSLLGWLALQLREPGVNKPKRTIGSHWRTQYALILEQNADLSEARLKDNLYEGDHSGRQGPERPLRPDFSIRYADLVRNPSVMVQIVQMYSRTIDELWIERESWKDQLKSLEAQTPGIG